MFKYVLRRVCSRRNLTGFQGYQCDINEARGGEKFIIWAANPMYHEHSIYLRPTSAAW